MVYSQVGLDARTRARSARSSGSRTTPSACSTRPARGSSRTRCRRTSAARCSARRAGSRRASGLPWHGLRGARGRPRPPSGRRWKPPSRLRKASGTVTCAQGTTLSAPQSSPHARPRARLRRRRADRRLARRGTRTRPSRGGTGITRATERHGAVQPIDSSNRLRGGARPRGSRPGALPAAQADQQNRGGRRASRGANPCFCRPFCCNWH